MNSNRHSVIPDEAMTIAKRGEMGLHQADCYLEYARLYMAMAKNDDAHRSPDIAREMVDETRYHWRDEDVLEIINSYNIPPSESRKIYYGMVKSALGGLMFW